MNIIVTNNTIEYAGFMKIKTLEEASKTFGEIEVLVYHKSNERTESKVEYLTKLKERVRTFVYIRDKDSYEQAIQMIIIGSGGKYFDDEFFLENSLELNNLINNLSEVTQLAELGGVGVLSDFFSRYLKDGSTGFNKAYLGIVKSAVSGMISDYKQKDLELLQLSETATELFSNSMSILSGVEEEREKLKSAVESLEKAKNEGALYQSGQPSNNVFFFPRVQYLKERKVIRIKELGNCSYLASFILGFKLYLERIHYVRVKLVVIHSVGEQYEKLYKDFTWITQSSSKDQGYYYNSIVFTNYPNKDVIHRLLDDTNYDIFIVVDRVKTMESHILNSKGILRYAVSGKSAMSVAGVRANMCFSSSDVAGSMFQIKYDSEFPKAMDQRERYYLREYSKAYDLLYSMRNSQ